MCYWDLYKELGRASPGASFLKQASGCVLICFEKPVETRWLFKFLGALKALMFGPTAHRTLLKIKMDVPGALTQRRLRIVRRLESPFVGIQCRLQVWFHKSFFQWATVWAMSSADTPIWVRLVGADENQPEPEPLLPGVRSHEMPTQVFAFDARMSTRSVQGFSRCRGE